MPIRIRRPRGRGGTGPITGEMGSSWLATIKSALRIQTVADHKGTEVKPGLAVSVVIPNYQSSLSVKPALDVDARAEGDLRVFVNPALDVDARAEGTAAKPEVYPGLQTSEQVSGVVRPDQRPALLVTSRGEGNPALPVTQPTLAVSTVNTGDAAKPDVLPGLDASEQVSGTVKPDQKPALVITTRGEGDPTRPPVNPALNLDAVLSAQPFPQNPAVDIQQITVDLNHLKGAGGVGQTGTWTATAQAGGEPNGVYATCSGEATAVTKTMRTDGWSWTSKSSLTITNVKLRWYVRITGVLLNDTTVRFQWRRVSTDSYTTLETITADFDNLATPREFTLPTDITESQFSTLQSRVEIVFPAVGTTKTFTMDACQLQVVANMVWVP